MGTGELRHDQAATSQIPDKAAKNRVRNARHGRQNSRGIDRNVADHNASRKTHTFSLAVGSIGRIAQDREIAESDTVRASG